VWWCNLVIANKGVTWEGTAEAYMVTYIDT
jgi:hypothetical protein